MARKFLYLIAVVTVMIIAAMFALRMWAADLTRLAMVPSVPFKAEPPLAASRYDEPAMWLSRPGMGAKDPARWLPKGSPLEEGVGVRAAVFFIHPTSYFEKGAWNAPLDDTKSQDQARLFVRGLASPFNRTAELWAPRYRQATVGAFLTSDPAGAKAIDLAQGDVEQAFDIFIETTGKDMPIVIAGHSQGALLALRLLRDRVAGKPLARRVVAAYIIGWPVSPAGDLPAAGLPACASPEQTGCVVSWSSFAEPAEPATIDAGVPASFTLDGKPRDAGPPLCTNPLTGTIGGRAPASANLGTLIPSADLSSGEIKAGMVPARCDARGLLLIGPPPSLGPYVLPGNNYHVYDIPLFWQNLRQDFSLRAGAWKP